MSLQPTIAFKKRDVMIESIRALGLLLVLVIAPVFAEPPGGPLKLHPANPHYCLFNGQATILITSTEYYGAVVNLDFDYVTKAEKRTSPK